MRLMFLLLDLLRDCDIQQDGQISWCHDITFYTYIMLKSLYAHDSVMMSVYDITENTL